MLLLTYQFHDLFEGMSGIWHKKVILCPTKGEHLSPCFRNLLIQRSLPANSTVHRTCLVLARELSSAKMEPTNPRAFSRTTFKEHRGKTSTHAPTWAFPVTFSVTLSNQSLPRARLHSVCSLWCSCYALCYSCFWLFCSYWICFYG